MVERRNIKIRKRKTPAGEEKYTNYKEICQPDVAASTKEDMQGNSNESCNIEGGMCKYYKFKGGTIYNCLSPGNSHGPLADFYMGGDQFRNHCRRCKNGIPVKGCVNMPGAATVSEESSVRENSDIGLAKVVEIGMDLIQNPIGTVVKNAAQTIISDLTDEVLKGE